MKLEKLIKTYTDNRGLCQAEKPMSELDALCLMALEYRYAASLLKAKCDRRINSSTTYKLGGGDSGLRGD